MHAIVAKLDQLSDIQAAVDATRLDDEAKRVDRARSSRSRNAPPARQPGVALQIVED
jgi:hypothetical protein